MGSAAIVVYFDIDDANTVSHLSHHIRKIGGECASFFSKDVTHLITQKTANVNAACMHPDAKDTEPSISPVNSTRHSASLNGIIPSADLPSRSHSNTRSSVSSTVKVHSSLSATPGASSYAVDKFGASPMAPSSSATSTTAQLPKLHAFGKENRLDTNDSRPKHNISVKLMHSMTSSSHTSVRPSALLQQSRTQQKYDLISKAKAMNTAIWSLEQLCAYLRQAYQVKEGAKTSTTKIEKRMEIDVLNAVSSVAIDTSFSVHGGYNLKQDTRQSKCSFDNTLTLEKLPSLSLNNASSDAAPGQFYTFQHPYVLIEDTLGIHRPFFKEFKPLRGGSKTSIFPTLYLDHVSPLACPFNKPSPFNKAKECLERESETDCAQNKNGNCVTLLSGKTLILPIKWIKSKKPGYCECCLEKYIDIEEHCKLPQHRKFAINDDNFNELDVLIATIVRPLKLSFKALPACTGTPKRKTLAPSPRMELRCIYLSKDSRNKRPFGSQSQSESRSHHKKTLAENKFIHVIEASRKQGEMATSEDVRFSKMSIQSPESPLSRKFGRFEHEHDHLKSLKIIESKLSTSDIEEDGHVEYLESTKCLAPCEENVKDKGSIADVGDGDTDIPPSPDKRTTIHSDDGHIDANYATQGASNATKFGPWTPCETTPTLKPPDMVKNSPAEKGHRKNLSIMTPQSCEPIKKKNGAFTTQPPIIIMGSNNSSQEAPDSNRITLSVMQNIGLERRVLYASAHISPANSKDAGTGQPSLRSMSIPNSTEEACTGPIRENPAKDQAVVGGKENQAPTGVALGAKANHTCTKRKGMDGDSKINVFDFIPEDTNQAPFDGKKVLEKFSMLATVAATRQLKSRMKKMKA